MVRFQADADLNQIIVAALVRRAPGVDFRTAEVAQLKGLHDRDVLALAAGSSEALPTLVPEEIDILFKWGQRGAAALRLTGRGRIHRAIPRFGPTLSGCRATLRGHGC